MAKHRSFTLDKFLKAVAPEQRSVYFSSKGITFPGEIDDSFDDFWDAIEDAKRVEIEEELQCINDTADKARDCLERAVKEFDISTQEDDTSETTAMRVFLHSEEAFSLAFDFWLYYHIFSERLTHHKFQSVKPNFSEAGVTQFKSAVEQYYQGCGKSEHCDVRYRPDGDKHILLVARGDFMRTHLIFDEMKNKPDVRSFRPAKEDMLVFNKSNNVLSLKISSRSQDDKKKYLEIFGNAFLGLDKIDDSTLNDSLVDLEPIRKRSFSYDGNEYIEGVNLTEVKARLGGLVLTLKATDLSGRLQSFGLGSDKAEYLSAKLSFFIKREGKKSKKIAVEIKPPENSKVPEKKEKAIIEDYLREQEVLLD